MRMSTFLMCALGALPLAGCDRQSEAPGAGSAAVSQAGTAPAASGAAPEAQGPDAGVSAQAPATTPSAPEASGSDAGAQPSQAPSPAEPALSAVEPSATGAPPAVGATAAVPLSAEAAAVPPSTEAAVAGAPPAGDPGGPDFMLRKTAAMQPAVRDAGLTYTVQCEPGATQAEACAVDAETYKGWRSFHAHCYQCHGGSGLGSTFAPNLMDRLNDHVDHARFHYVLHNGYTGKVGAMPSFEANAAVLKDLDALYRYLRARADEALPAGRPTRAAP